MRMLQILWAVLQCVMLGTYVRTMQVSATGFFFGGFGVFVFKHEL